MYLALFLLSIFIMAVLLVESMRAHDFSTRMLFINLFGAMNILLLCAVCLISRHNYFVDIVLLYALLNFLGTLAVLKYARFVKKAPSVKL